MENLFNRMFENGGLILPASECSEECLRNAKDKNAYYDDGHGNACVHLTISELNEYGGGIKNPKP